MILEDIKTIDKYKDFIKTEGDTTDNYYEKQIAIKEQNLKKLIKEHHISLNRQRAAIEIFILISIINIAYIKYKKSNLKND